MPEWEETHVQSHMQRLFLEKSSDYRGDHTCKKVVRQVGATGRNRRKKNSVHIASGTESENFVNSQRYYDYVGRS